MKKSLSTIILSILCAFFMANAMAEIRYEVHRGLIPEKYIPVLTKFDTDLFYEYPYLFIATAEYESWFYSVVSTPSTILILALDGDEVVGEIIALATEEGEGHSDVLSKHPEYKPKKCLFIASLGVTKDYQRQGIGRQLIRRYEIEAQNQGYTESYVMTVMRSKNHPFEPANKFDLDKVWQHLGFKEMEVYELWNWPTRVGEPGKESVAVVDNMVQYWYKKIK